MANNKIQINWPESAESAESSRNAELHQEGGRNVKMGLGVGAFGAGSLALIGVSCPLCFVVAPAMVGVGMWKQRKAKRALADSSEFVPGSPRPLRDE